MCSCISTEFKVCYSLIWFFFNFCSQKPHKLICFSMTFYDPHPGYSDTTPVSITSWCLEGSGFWLSHCKIQAINLFTPTLLVTMASLGPFSASDVITFYQNWHHLYSTPARRNNLSNNTQTSVISPVEPEICTRMLKKVSENSEQNFLSLQEATPW